MESEFEFIEKIRRRAPAASIKTGIGDDCAVIAKDSQKDLVMTADLLVEDVDFRLDWTIPEFLGHKALAVSLSDVAAMGARPVWAMLSIGIPAKIWKTNFVEKFYDGWLKLAEKFGVGLIGGDVSRTPGKIVIDSIVGGEIKKNSAILRSTAKAGDLIFVTGRLGGAAAGLRLLEAGERYDKNSESAAQKLLRRQLKPDPRVEIGQILARENLATAMIDLSDGLSSDLPHLCRASRTGAKVFAGKIPLDARAGNFLSSTANRAEKPDGKNLRAEKLNLALHGGEDFELLFTVSPKKIFRLQNALKKSVFSLIGEITANVGTIELIDTSGSTILAPKGFRHF